VTLWNHLNAIGRAQVAEGRHHELLESNELYRSLCAQLVDEPAQAAIGHASSS
jgi:hypothetical protein